MDLGSPAFRGRQDFPDDALLYYAGLLAPRHRSAVSLEGLLRDYFDLPVEVEQFAGRWQELNPADRLALGTPEGNNSLGVTTVLGDRVWDARGKIRLRVGPLTFDQFRSLIPDGPALRPFVQMVRLYVGV
ncbi:MAG: type VI secretion system baseplate subunit TssG, partial [Singulisphaera sp.]